ncbi:MAG: AAA family ATPase, partial [Patescibacteria group bacterium]
KSRTDQLEKLAVLSAAEEQRLGDLRTQLQHLRLEGPRAQAQKLTVQSARFTKFRDRIAAVAKALSTDAVQTIASACGDLATKRGAADKISAHFSQGYSLAGVGSTEWRELWDSARRYSEHVAYPDAAFPATHDAARCVLCQQELSAEARQRFTNFETFVRDDTQRQVTAAETRLQQLIAPVSSLDLSLPPDDPTLQEIALTSPVDAQAIATFFSSAETRKAEVVGLASMTTNEARTVASLAPSPEAVITALITNLSNKAKQISDLDDPAKLSTLANECAELADRETLRKNKDKVAKEIRRHVLLAKYERAKKSCDTRGMTILNTELTKEIVTDSLTAAFQRELNALNLQSVSVTIASDGKKGALYHRIYLPTQAPGARIEQILSEGEFRCIALAAFLADVASEPSGSAIILDDPVSSLDHLRRDAVAQRLVREAQSRQVIVFTHELGFLMFLIESAEAAGISCETYCLKRLGDSPGYAEPGLPWHGQNTKKRIGQIKDDLQRARTAHSRKESVAYEAQARRIYALLRETWERAVEEVLLNESVQRFCRAVQTKRIAALTDITKDDYAKLDAAMAKCSTWMLGHDDAPTVAQPIPGPDELSADVAALETWCKSIRDRRKG